MMIKGWVEKKAWRRESLKKMTSFSLIEALVVFAFISILMSLLLPSLNKTLSYTRKNTCSTNLKQWGVLFDLYSEDFEGELPNANFPGWFTNIDYLLDIKTTEYEIGEGKNFGIFQCPENSEQIRPVGYGIGESQNSYMPNGWNDVKLFLSTNKWKHEAPSKLYALFESLYFRSQPWHNTGVLTPYSSGVPLVRYPHSGGVNMLHADAHVDWLPPTLQYRGGYLGGSAGPNSFANGVYWYAY